MLVEFDIYLFYTYNIKNEYPYAVPCVIDDAGNWFLKTAYPCRKLKGRV